jgi:phosphoglycerate dehydrogenase-like enzyme
MTGNTRSVGFAFRPGDELLQAFQSECSDLDIKWIVPKESPNKDWVLENLMETDVYIGWNPPEQLLRKSTTLKLVLNPGAGIWHQLKKLRDVYLDKGITLCNGHGNDYFTAQHAVALLLSACNRLGIHERLLRAGKWRSSDSDGASIPLLNRKVGLLGYGHSI